MSGPILRALLLVLQASHRAFANCDKSVIHGGWIMRPEDHAALNVALVRLSSRLPSTAAEVSLTLRTEIALESLLASLEGGSQVHPDSALPSRTDFDTTEAQYVALASMRETWPMPRQQRCLDCGELHVHAPGCKHGS